MIQQLVGERLEPIKDATEMKPMKLSAWAISSWWLETGLPLRHDTKK